MLSRQEALRLVKERVKKENFVKHMLAVEAIMRALAKELGGDEELWGLAGLLHDLDFEETTSNPSLHGVKACLLLEGLVPEEVLRAIRAHNYEHTGVKPETAMEKALVAADAASGLLVACALVMPNKRLEEVKLETVIRKFKAKDFARGVSRERILMCEQLGLSKERFLSIALEALKSIAGELGL
ncbi:MAG: phosphohydrolase [Thermoprotei archaeon]|nr:MAG: phosphohydrolase [Thermoprotei archaeon]RLF18112.1 MAG: phosphohydrolase [Thermoprotei archaeon]